MFGTLFLLLPAAAFAAPQTSAPTTATAPAAATATGSDQYNDPVAFRTAMLDETNVYRRLFQAPKLSWNDTLAAYAAQWAAGCRFEHSGGPYGENLAAGYPSPVAVVDAWGDEYLQYNFKKPGFSEATGHFTQLVWLNTTSVGCAAMPCNNAAQGGAPGWLVVCEYWPAGNVIGYFAQSVKGAIGMRPSKNVTSAAPASRVSWAVLVEVAAGFGAAALLASV